MAEYAVPYTDKAKVKADLGRMSATDNDVALDAAILSASREVDGWTNTRFGVTGDPETRLFDGDPSGVIAVDRFTSTTGLMVKTGSGGTYATTVPAASYVLRNASGPGPDRTGAYDTIVVPSMPTYYGDGWPGVAVTVLWGYDFIPAAIEQATRLRAIHIYHRRESPHGVAGYGDDGLGGRVTLDEDADVVRLLAPYTDPAVA